jgi:hypothetical protein
MDWQEIKTALCASRDFTHVHDGVRVLADTMMPSGMLIHVHMQMRDGFLHMHDNGAAFDELAQHGRECKSASAVKRLLEETNFRLTSEGQIFRDRVRPEDVGVGVSMVADASLRAAQYMLAHSKSRIGQPLDVRVRDALHRRFPNGTPKFRFNGRAKQQVFDFGFEHEGEIVLVDAVSPDASSVNAAIVKSLDVVRSTEHRARPILVYDHRDGWSSDILGLLDMAPGHPVSFERVADGRLLAA